MLKTASSAASGERGLAARAAVLRPLFDVRYLAAVSAAATYALIVLGGTVRATDAGLACPDWPRCHGQLIPPLEGSVIIEYTHRLAAASVGLLILGVALTAWLRHRDNPFVVVGSTLALVVVTVQAIIGGVTVNMELPDSIVALHLAIALLLLAILVATVVGAVWHGRPSANGSLSTPGQGSGSLQLVTALAALAVLALILLGSYVATSNAALIYPDWPLFDGKLVSAGGRLANLHYAHRLMAAVVGLALVTVTALTWRRQRSAVVMTALIAALTLYVAEVFVGASNIWFKVATEARVAHLALAAAVWVALVLSVAWGYAERVSSTVRGS